MTVTHLFLKDERRKPLTPVSKLECTEVGVTGGVPTSRWRQLLLMCASTLKNLEIEPGVLRENVVIKLDSLHDLPSGSVLRIGEVRVRLTFHCEPCGRIPSSIPRKAILHRRGVLCAILEGGTIRVGDRVALTGEKCDNIPYDIIDRLAWYIDRVDECVNVMTLLNDIGLSPSYARAMPSYLKRLPPRYRERVVFNGAAKRVSERQQR